MSLQPYIPALVAALVVSVAALVGAGSSASILLALAATFGFAAAICVAAVVTNRPLWADDAELDSETAFHACRRNARLMMLVYAWGGAAILAVYTLSGLYWFHYWQYGAGMMLIAGLLLAYVHYLGNEGVWLASPEGLDAAAWLAFAHALGITGGLVFLTVSGKLALAKPDWVANRVFLAGGLALVIVSLISINTHRTIRARLNGEK